MNKVILSIGFTILFIATQDVFSAQTSFQFSAPPVPWYEFQKGQKDMKLSATGLLIEGTIDSPEQPEAGGDVSIWGGSGGGFYRYAFRDEFAFDAGITALLAGGDVGNSATMNMSLLTIPFGLEYLAVHTDKTSVIIFGGMNFTWLTLGIDINTGTEKASIDVWTSMRGPQGGIQAASKFTDFVLTPFIMVTRLSGSATIDYAGGGESGSISTGIPSTTTVSYGLDIVYVPANITLSSIIQQSLANDENNGMRTYIMTLNYRIDFTENNNSIENTEPVQIKKAKPVKQTGKTAVK